MIVALVSCTLLRLPLIHSLRLCSVHFSTFDCYRSILHTLRILIQWKIRLFSRAILVLSLVSLFIDCYAGISRKASLSLDSSTRCGLLFFCNGHLQVSFSFDCHIKILHIQSFSSNRLLRWYPRHSFLWDSCTSASRVFRSLRQYLAHTKEIYLVLLIPQLLAHF